MRPSSYRNLLAFFALSVLSSSLVGCPEKGGTDKTTAEPEERAEEPDDDDKAEKKPASAATPAAPADDRKPDEDKDKGGW